MKIAMGSDHAGLELKTFLLDELRKRGYEITDCGAYTDESVDYPDFAEKVCSLIRSGEVRYGILVCATGIGISIAANKQKGIRAALCTTEFTAFMSRQHNDANVLALGGMVTGKLLALSITETFLREEFSLGERHIRRIDKMMNFERC
ncbi:MAG: ribose 5-phosphate isomerase B [Candidatus Latescibacterota bacterium]